MKAPIILTYLCTFANWFPHICAQARCQNLKEKITQVDCLKQRIEQLCSLPQEEKEVLQRQINALESDLKFKREQQEYKKRSDEFECRLEDVRDKIAEMEEKLNAFGNVSKVIYDENLWRCLNLYECICMFFNVLLKFKLRVFPRRLPVPRALVIKNMSYWSGLCHKISPHLAWLSQKLGQSKRSSYRVLAVYTMRQNRHFSRTPKLIHFFYCKLNYYLRIFWQLSWNANVH